MDKQMNPVSFLKYISGSALLLILSTHFSFATEKSQCDNYENGKNSYKLEKSVVNYIKEFGDNLATFDPEWQKQSKAL